MWTQASEKGMRWKTVIGNKISEEDLKEIKELKYGNNLFIDCMKVKNKIGSIYAIGIFYYHIVPSKIGRDIR